MKGTPNGKQICNNHSSSSDNHVTLLLARLAATMTGTPQEAIAKVDQLFLMAKSVIAKGRSAPTLENFEIACVLEVFSNLTIPDLGDLRKMEHAYDLWEKCKGIVGARETDQLKEIFEIPPVFVNPHHPFPADFTSVRFGSTTVSVVDVDSLDFSKVNCLEDWLRELMPNKGVPERLSKFRECLLEIIKGGPRGRRKSEALSESEIIDLMDDYIQRWKAHPMFQAVGPVALAHLKRNSAWFLVWNQNQTSKAAVKKAKNAARARWKKVQESSLDGRGAV